MEQALISVIVPVYNVEKYLPECVESIISQTYGNLEVILIDDGSTDRSGKICDEFAEKDSRIVAVHQKNSGVSAARNRGLDVCNGENVSFVDSDDYISADLISSFSDLLIQSGADCVAGGFIETDDKKNEKSAHAVKGQIAMDGWESLITRYTDYRFELNLNNVWGKLFRKEIFSDIRFTEKMFFEDILIMPYWCMKCNKIVYTPYTGYYYRRNENSTTMNRNPEHLKKLYNDSFTIFNTHIALYEKCGNTKLRNCIENELADKIITHSINGTIPAGLEKWTKSEFNRHYKAIMNSGISPGRKAKMTFFRIAGIRCSRFLCRLRRRT